MQEILTIGKTIVETGSTAALIGVLVILAFPKLKAKIFNGNGYDKKVDDIGKTLLDLETNHLHTIEEKIDKLHEKFDVLIEVNREMLFHIKEMRNIK